METPRSAAASSMVRCFSWRAWAKRVPSTRGTRLDVPRTSAAAWRCHATILCRGRGTTSPSATSTPSEACRRGPGLGAAASQGRRRGWRGAGLRGRRRGAQSWGACRYQTLGAFVPVTVRGNGPLMQAQQRRQWAPRFGRPRAHPVRRAGTPASASARRRRRRPRRAPASATRRARWRTPRARRGGAR